MSKSKQSLHNQESGFVAIMVSIVVMIILTLILLGYARLMQHEKQQSLDRQLSAQAYYAAETGINDAARYLIDNPNTEITDCNMANNPLKAAFIDDLDATTGVGYTCVLIDASPTTLEYEVGTSSSVIVPIQIKNPAGKVLDNITISWEDSQGNTNFATNNNHYLPMQGATDSSGTFPWNATGMLRTSVIPVSSGGAANSALIAAQQGTYFFYPKSFASASATPGSFTYAATPNDAKFIDGRCNTGNKGSGLPAYCNVRINGLAALGTDTVYLRLKAIYNPVKVTITARDSSGGVIEFIGAQATIDSTGKANDVLRRIRQPRSLLSSYAFPEFAVQSMDSICKRLMAYPGGATIDSAYGANTNINDPNNPCSIK